MNYRTLYKKAGTTTEKDKKDVSAPSPSPSPSPAPAPVSDLPPKDMPIRVGEGGITPADFTLIEAERARREGKDLKNFYIIPPNPELGVREGDRIQEVWVSCNGDPRYGEQFWPTTEEVENMVIVSMRWGIVEELQGSDLEIWP